MLKERQIPPNPAAGYVGLSGVLEITSPARVRLDASAWRQARDAASLQGYSGLRLVEIPPRWLLDAFQDVLAFDPSSRNRDLRKPLRRVERRLRDGVVGRGSRGQLEISDLTTPTALTQDELNAESKMRIQWKGSSTPDWASLLRAWREAER